MPKSAPPGPFEALPEALAILRERAGFTTSQAFAAHLETRGVGFEAGAYEDWERGTTSPDLAELGACLEVLGFDLHDLQTALDGAGAEPVAKFDDPHPLESFLVAGRGRLEYDAPFRENLKALAAAAGLEDVVRRLERLEERLREQDPDEEGQ